MVEKILDLKHTPRKSFKNHFLNQVHSEIRFDGNFTSNIIGSLEPLKNMFKTLGFEAHRPVMLSNFAFKVGKDGEAPTMENNSSTVGYAFISQNPRKEVQVVGDKIVFSDFSYEGFEEFSTLLQNISNEVMKIIPYKGINKIGLRKINSIKIAPVTSFQDACLIFNPSIFNTIRSGLVVDDSLKFNEEKIVLEKGTDFCLMQFRIKKLNEPNAFEANLDFDIVSKTAHSLDEIFNDTLPKINNEHFNLFMWAITDDLIKLMES